MCARYCLATNLQAFADLFEVVPEDENLLQRIEIFPSEALLLVSRNGERHAQIAKWGYVPGWVKEPKSKPVNARSETIFEKPYYRTAAKKDRCLIPATAFYEWHGPKRYQIETNTPLFAMGGLRADHPEFGLNGAILTTSPNQLIGTIHDRMPVILEPEFYEEWLDPQTPSERIQELMRPFPSEWMTMKEVERFLTPRSKPVGQKPQNEPSLFD